MNIFFLDSDPKTAAQMHCDKHCIKMIVEHAQMLSTAHRILDGDEHQIITATGRRAKRFVLPDDREQALYKSTHANHPSAAWVRQSAEHYDWLLQCTKWLLNEYTHRYGKVHATSRVIEKLNNLPYNISNKGFVEPPQAMPDQCKVVGDAIKAYRNYYVNEKRHFAKWTNRPTPSWFI